MRNDDNDEVDNYNYKMEIQKLKINLTYGIIIFIMSIATVITWACSNKTKFVDEVSFASTISSIILSVIAIIMTIIGEEKTDNTKNKLVELSDNLETITNDIKDSTKGLERLSGLDDKLNKIDNMVERVKHMEKIITEKNEKVGIMDKIELSKPIDSQNHVSSNEVNYIDLYNNMVLGAPNKYILSGLYYIFKMIENGNSIPVENFVKLMSQLKIDSYSAQYYWGMCMVFTSRISSITMSKEEIEFKNLINKEIEKPGLSKCKEIVDTFIKEN
ncbi:MAG: hypothetical protein PHX70_06530 [Clostridium sp.]|nr:hypothetical protein [Clostridium sp.]